MSSLCAALDAPKPLIEDVALAIAEDEYPGLGRQRYHDWLDGLAEPIADPMAAESDLETRIALLTDHVYDRLGFVGNADDYYDPRNSYFNQVLERRKGIPITLAVLLMALGRRLDLPVEGIGFPGHFLVRAGGAEGMYLDPFNHGNIVEPADLTELARRFLGGRAELARGQLEPVTPRVIAVRMLFNLQQIYEKRGDHARAFIVCDRLVSVADAPFHVRDRGLHALAIGADQVAIDDFQSYLGRGATDVDIARIQELLDKAKSRAHKHMN